MKKQKLVVFYGGRSTEHEVSCRSAAYVLRHAPQEYDLYAIGIDKQGVWHSLPKDLYQDEVPEILPVSGNAGVEIDSTLKELGLLPHLGVNQSGEKPIVFSVIHGNGGEDGKLQGLLELLEVPYVGPDVLGSALAMDKHVAKLLVEKEGVKVGPYRAFRLEEWVRDRGSVKNEINSHLSYPIFVKPARGGSSVGISKVHSKEHLEEALESAFTYDDKIMVEQGLVAREIECAAVGGYYPCISSPGEVIPKAEFYNYDAKYVDPEGALIKIPAENLSSGQLAELRRLSALCFKVLNLYGMARVDFFVDKVSGEIYFSEANTIPGFTAISQFPMLWAHEGVQAPDLIEDLIENARLRARPREKMKFAI